MRISILKICGILFVFVYINTPFVPVSLELWERLIYLPAFLFHIMTSFITIDTKGKVNCKLSVIDIRSPQTLISECIQGITQTKVTMIISIKTLVLATNFSRVVSLTFGQRPINFKLQRFNSIAHWRSSYQKNIAPVWSC